MIVAQMTAMPVRTASFLRFLNSIPSQAVTKTERTKNGVSSRKSLTINPKMKEYDDSILIKTPVFVW
jgi:hypothetical protein